ncbi:hypothetical protein OIO90_005744 [Microbotryomycetes sp. JL221]|nr:hypothetical protein OIO90_005744 [Microbotryomycetes sp. JL221]
MPTRDGVPLTTEQFVFTTDARHLLEYSPSVSFAWWLEPTKTQFRVRALASVVPSPANSAFDQAPPAQCPYDGFDWEQERLRHWRKLTPELRASFLRPSPGTELKGDAQVWREKLVSDVEADTPEARQLNAQGRCNEGETCNNGLTDIALSACKFRTDHIGPIRDRRLRAGEASPQENALQAEQG